jgi:2-hydroxy-3-keto-5-methylthiopentenyl-1-phosphate phosphatase
LNGHYLSGGWVLTVVSRYGVHMRLHFAIDFDGTIALDDTTDLLLDRRAEPQWLDVEQEWLAGRIGSRECLAQQAALIRATPEELDAALSDVVIDPDFTRFVVAAHRMGSTMQIVSDGFDRCILPVLDRAAIDLPVTSNRLRPVGQNHWAAEFPAFASDCKSTSGVCKCLAAQTTERMLVLIGDGRSDFCLASRADVVLAKGKLAAHCAEKNYPFTPINSFADVLDWLQPFLGEQTPGAFPRP